MLGGVRVSAVADQDLANVLRQVRVTQATAEGASGELL